MREVLRCLRNNCNQETYKPLILSPIDVELWEKKLRETLERWRRYITKAPFQIAGELPDTADKRLRQEIEGVLK